MYNPEKPLRVKKGTFSTYIGIDIGEDYLPIWFNFYSKNVYVKKIGVLKRYSVG